jgi:hypothetical protein
MARTWSRTASSASATSAPWSTSAMLRALLRAGSRALRAPVVRSPAPVHSIVTIFRTPRWPPPGE